MRRLLWPGVAIISFMALGTLYNQWTGLTATEMALRTAATLGSGVLLFGPAVMVRARHQAIYCGVVSLLVAVLMLANAVYMAYAGGFLSASTLSYAWQAADTGGSILALLHPVMLFYFLPAMALLIWALLLDRRHPDWHFERLHWRPAGVVLGVIILVAAGGYSYVATKEIRKFGNLNRIVKQPYDSRELVREVGIINYSLLDIAHYLHRKRSLSAEEVRYVEEHRAEQVRVGSANVMTGVLAGRNVVFLQLESFQQFLIGRRVNGQEITPNLNKLAAASQQFTNFHYIVGPGTSSDAEFVTFNSLLPLANAATVFDYPANDFKAYPAELKQSGYTTRAYHADSRSFWNRTNTFPRFGFDEYWAEENYRKGEMIGFGLNDRDFFSQTADDLKQLPQPFYAHLITLTSHTPFKLPESDKTLNMAGVDLDWIQSGYLESAHYTDAAVGEFMARLEKDGLSQKTAVVIMGDHEGFIFKPDDKRFAQFLGYANGFDDFSYLNTRNIPFMVYAPGALPSGVDDRPVSQIDIYPTLMNLLGKPASTTILGVDLYGAQEPLTVRRDRGVGSSLQVARQGALTYLAQSLKGGGEVCYQGTVAATADVCASLKQQAIERSIMSDYVIMGNRIDLLAERKP